MFSSGTKSPKCESSSSPIGVSKETGSEDDLHLRSERPMDSRRRHLAEEQEEYSCIYPTEWQPSGTYQHIARKRKERGDGTDKTMAKINDNLTVGIAETKTG